MRLMFQDEARFGRMVRPRRCWAPAPLRPVISNGYERQRMGRQSRKVAEHDFAWDYIAAQYVEIYRKVLGEA